MKKTIKALILLFVMACAFTACSSKDSSQDADDLNGTLSESNLDSANSRIDERYADGSIPLAEENGMFRDVNFGFDSSSVDDLGRQNIEYNVQIIQAHPEIQIQLEGHCDERGTAEYNFALGSRRAQSVFDMLVSYGIPSSRLKVISYGEEVPLDPASNEMAWAKNRRVHFAPYGGQLQ